MSNGGATLLPPVDLPEVGRMALFIDPPGGVFGVWQPGEVRGAELVGAPGSMCWNQLASRNIESSKRFYGAVFGWVSSTTPYETSSYTSFRLDGRDVAGMVEMDRSWPRDLPSHWMTYVGVEDCDAAVEQAVALGGEVSVEPYDMPHLGRTAVLGDPHGAVFSVLTLSPDFTSRSIGNGARSYEPDPSTPKSHDADDLGPRVEATRRGR